MALRKVARFEMYGKVISCAVIRRDELMDTSKENLVMTDFAIHDPRSVSAMLRGAGDGREQGWLKFCERRGSDYHEEGLHAAYKTYSRIVAEPVSNAIPLGKSVLWLIAIAAIVF